MATYSQTQGNSKKMLVTIAKPKLRLSISERVVANWNSLPDDEVTAPSVSCFKTRLDAHWKNLQSIFDLVSLYSDAILRM